MNRTNWLLVLAMMAAPLAAHEGHDRVEKAANAVSTAVVKVGAPVETAVVTAKGKVASAVNVTGEAVRSATAEVGAQLEPMETLRKSLPSHIHNKLVHFPVALGIFGALFLLLSYRYPSYKWPARTLLFFAAAFASLAVPYGLAQADSFKGTSLEQVLAWHHKIALNVVFILWGALLLSFFEFTRKFFWIYALWLIAGILMAAGLGGILATS